ncbi:hypothetical protein P175DRAFT_059301 [Aspergillus ochraceoroseus IBT 24754]|uniref:Uncharacterized protein n=1 Tax=Aspergillus ochraceoroseus IBT 24754 TaxID=1392256 RepID=A0A2T5M933_9EURO|nr:uncharacterized protein P175DRAFT_059301 [Aspergillus ochraceoroseus IBT 24754]PTU25037.1 hypothetical protein P175DRAFT_059301 [Aspergillus ochraceoroseus IBT 24754]
MVGLSRCFQGLATESMKTHLADQKFWTAPPLFLGSDFELHLKITPVGWLYQSLPCSRHQALVGWQGGPGTNPSSPLLLSSYLLSGSSWNLRVRLGPGKGGVVGSGLGYSFYLLSIYLLSGSSWYLRVRLRPGKGGVVGSGLGYSFYLLSIYPLSGSSCYLGYTQARQRWGGWVGPGLLISYPLHLSSLRLILVSGT